MSDVTDDTVDGWVWCEHRYEFGTDTDHYDIDGYGDCPGPHRQIILGPQLEDAAPTVTEPVPRCPVCGGVDSVEVSSGWEDQRQWRCSCGNEHWYDSGTASTVTDAEVEAVATALRIGYGDHPLINDMARVIARAAARARPAPTITDAERYAAAVALSDYDNPRLPFAVPPGAIDAALNAAAHAQQEKP